MFRLFKRKPKIVTVNIGGINYSINERKGFVYVHKLDDMSSELRDNIRRLLAIELPRHNIFLPKIKMFDSKYLKEN